MVGINIEVLRRKSLRCMEEYVVLRITLQKKKKKRKRTSPLYCNQEGKVAGYRSRGSCGQWKGCRKWYSASACLVSELHESATC